MTQDNFDFDNQIERIKQKINTKKNPPFFVVLAGGVGSGKTFFAISLQNIILSDRNIRINTIDGPINAATDGIRPSGTVRSTPIAVEIERIIEDEYEESFYIYTPLVDNPGQYLQEMSTQGDTDEVREIKKSLRMANMLIVMIDASEEIYSFNTKAHIRNKTDRYTAGVLKEIQPIVIGKSDMYTLFCISKIDGQKDEINQSLERLQNIDATITKEIPKRIRENTTLESKYDEAIVKIDGNNVTGKTILDDMQFLFNHWVQVINDDSETYKDLTLDQFSEWIGEYFEERSQLVNNAMLDELGSESSDLLAKRIQKYLPITSGIIQNWTGKYEFIGISAFGDGHNAGTEHRNLDKVVERIIEKALQHTKSRRRR